MSMEASGIIGQLPEPNNGVPMGGAFNDLGLGAYRY